MSGYYYTRVLGVQLCSGPSPHTHARFKIGCCGGGGGGEARIMPFQLQQPDGPSLRFEKNIAGTSHLQFIAMTISSTLTISSGAV